MESADGSGQRMLRANTDHCQEALKCFVKLRDLLSPQDQGIPMEVRDFQFSSHKQTWTWRGREPMVMLSHKARFEPAKAVTVRMSY